MMTEITVTPLTDRFSFLAEWAALYPEAHENFFRSPAWMDAWLADIPPAANLHRIDVKSGDLLVLLGVIALPKRQPPVLGLAESWFHEFGESARDAIYVEYNDFLVSRDAPSDTRQAAIKKLLETFSSLDGFVFRNLTPEMTAAAKAVASVSGLAVRVLQEQPVYVCHLAQDNFEVSLSKSLRTKIRRSKKLYNDRGDLSCRVVGQGEDFPPVWSKMTELHEAGWSARNAPSVFDNAQLNAFHDRLQKASPEATHLFEVKAGEETIAVLYNFVQGDRVMNYQCGFLFEEDNRLAPGFVAHSLAAQHYRDAGYKTYDLLAGEADYKKRLGAVETTLTSLVLERNSWRVQLRRMLRG